ncbi:unnamed protein product [Bursaphelenchus okinawaensis]|uniref:Conserved oligomeric Golgi complex subunit 7 n=1 Tax=Bursaphelenchus okinawaensis TaxID=465554 RepID=A0A811KI13_9BILA|nr:unnamed protein product [Bursaphelenchus okinawaensis]CAG9103604.1 unnamed protein product [Bursaphelenchus okinawaensis]
MDASKIEQFLRNGLKNENLLDAKTLNAPEVRDNLKETEKVVERLLEELAVRIRTTRTEIASPKILGKFKDLGNANQKLDKRLQSHIQKLRKNEGSLVGTSDVLEFDSAKGRSDRLVEVINAKNMWESSLRVVDMMGESEQNELFGYLVNLQKSNEILKRYVSSQERDHLLETRKDLFLSWFSSAILFAIDSNDSKLLLNLKEKFDALDRTSDYRKTFGAFITNKICTFIDDNQQDLTLLKLLDEAFNLWKRTSKIATQLFGESGSSFVAISFYEGITSKDNVVKEIINRMMEETGDAFATARQLSTLRKDFEGYVKSEGDEAVQNIINRFCDDLYEIISDDLSKHIKSVLMIKINEILQSFNQKAHKNHEWVIPILESVHSLMRDLITETVDIFGASFSKFIVPTFENGIDQIHSMFKKSDILGLKVPKMNLNFTLDEVNDKLICMCVVGYLLNMVDDLNNFIHDVYNTHKDANDPREPYVIRNGQLLEKYARKVVQNKIVDLSKFLVISMTDEMNKLKSDASMNDSKPSLPTFSITPHNYITTVGHGLLSQVNNIAAYNNDRNFKSAVQVSAGDEYNEEECDLWVLKAIVTLLMDSFCANIGDPTKLSTALLRQFNADVVFLLEALEDLRLQPTDTLTALADKINDLCTKK